MPHFMIVLTLYINSLKLSWIKKCLFLRNMEPLNKFYIKVFKTLYFLNPQMDLLYIIWHDYIYWSRILFTTVLTPPYDLELKVTDF